jgi:hypothetical protein
MPLRMTSTFLSIVCLSDILACVFGQKYAAWRKYTKFWRWANTPLQIEGDQFFASEWQAPNTIPRLFYLLELWNNRGCDVCFSAAASNNNHFIAECAFFQTCLKWKKTSRWLSFRKNSPGNSFETLTSVVIWSAGLEKFV